MRNLYFLLFLVFFSSSYAQPTFGLKAGLNFSHVTSTTITTFPDGSQIIRHQSASKAVVRPMVGLWTYLPVSNRLSLLTDIQAVQKSWFNQHDNFFAHIDYELFYLSLPIQVGYRLKRWDFHLGPELNYLLYANDQINFGSFNIEPSTLELGVTAGLSYHFTHWFLNLRASRDLTPLFELRVNNIFFSTSDEFAVYHQGIQLTLGYHLPAMRKHRW